MKNTTLVILAGGEGTRLGELTKTVPKPMVDILGKPFLYLLIEHYRSQGLTDILISTGYKADVIENYPWPKKWKLLFVKDDQHFNGAHELYNWKNRAIVVNGDTWIPKELPREPGPWILACNGIDAGAQRPGEGKIIIIPTEVFYDIGTPTGLEQFRGYFKTHLDNKTKTDTLVVRK